MWNGARWGLYKAAPVVVATSPSFSRAVRAATPAPTTVTPRAPRARAAAPVTSSIKDGFGGKIFFGFVFAFKQACFSQRKPQGAEVIKCEDWQHFVCHFLFAANFVTTNQECNESRASADACALHELRDVLGHVEPLQKCNDAIHR